MDLKRRICCCSSIPEAASTRFVKQMFWLLCLTILPSVAVIIYCCIGVHSRAVDILSLGRLLTTFEPLVNSKRALEAITNEASEVVAAVALSSSPADGQPTVEEIYEKTDAAVRDLDSIASNAEGFPWQESKEGLMHELNRVRPNARDFKFLRSNSVQVLEAYRNLARTVIFSPTRFIFSNPPSSGMPPNTVLIDEMVEALAGFGMAESYGTAYFLKGRLSGDEQINFVRQLHLARMESEGAIHLNRNAKILWDRKRDEMALFWQALADAEEKISNDEGDGSQGRSEASNWRERNKLRCAILEQLMKTAEAEMIEFLESKRSEMTTYLIVHVACLCLEAFLILPLSFLGSLSNATSLRSYIKLVELKSLEIRKEKRKTEHLLHEMLPKSMAFRLQKGEQIYAEQFHSVSIFFSDIADFTEISTRSVPIDIISFLNDVYNFIDSLIVKYDVYKVETINCVYMVSSGIPSRNGDRHCVEIARLSIDLIKACEEFVIPHLKDHKLQLRIGVHTGPAVGGIVGNKMPRYCLFGDTVNTASRMQANGLPHKIHITSETNEALMINGGFRTELRGKIEVKGKGSMVTYWLLGREENRQ